MAPAPVSAEAAPATIAPTAEAAAPVATAQSEGAGPAQEQLPLGHRATALHNIYSEALAHTVKQISYDKFASCFPTPAAYCAESLRSLWSRLMTRFEMIARVSSHWLVIHSPASISPPKSPCQFRPCSTLSIRLEHTQPRPAAMVAQAAADRLCLSHYAATTIALAIVSLQFR
jgi:hypothetical protein